MELGRLPHERPEVLFSVGERERLPKFRAAAGVEFNRKELAVVGDEHAADRFRYLRTWGVAAMSLAVGLRPFTSMTPRPGAHVSIALAPACIATLRLTKNPPSGTPAPRFLGVMTQCTAGASVAPTALRRFERAG